MKRSAIKKRPLSDTTLEALKPEDKEYRELDGNGLYFRVKPNNKKSWQLRYKKTDGSWSWLGMGSYPAVSASFARKRAKEILEKIANGESIQTKIDIQKQKVEEEKLKFGTLLHDWLDTKQSHWGKDTYDKAVKSINRHIIPKFGERNLQSISPDEWFEFFQGLQRDLNIYTQVEKLTSYCRNAYDWAKFRKKIMYNPLEGITKHLDKNTGGNMKFVEIEEFPALIHSIRAYPKRNIAIGLELFALLFPRPVEMRFATWDQFDLEKGVWIKPREIMKKDIPHGVPLSRQAIGLLKELEKYRTESNLLFPSRDSLSEPISDNTFNMALNRLGYKDRQNPHGFRHIASTQLNNKYSDKEQVVESSLAHLKKGVKGVYDKGAHFQERIEMMQWWADEIDRMVN